jgi:hypothetical protein
MADTERRDIYQCVYAPAQPAEGETPLPEGPRAVLKVSSLRVAFANVALRKQVVGQLGKVGVAGLELASLFSMDDDELTPDQWKLLAQTPVATVAELARAAVDAEAGIVMKAAAEYQKAWADAEEKLKAGGAESAPATGKEGDSASGVVPSVPTDDDGAPVVPAVSSAGGPPDPLGALLGLVVGAISSATTTVLGATGLGPPSLLASASRVQGTPAATVYVRPASEAAGRPPQGTVWAQPAGVQPPPATLPNPPTPVIPVAVPLDPRTLTRRASEYVERRRRVVRALADAVTIEPVGWLHLERVEMTPTEAVPGAFVQALTLLPGETIRITHREWSRTDTEFTKLVATSLETATEDAISEKSELTESTMAQRQHSQAFNASLSASGNFGFMSIAANAGVQINNNESNSQNVSRQRTREATRKASSRAKQEHKVSFRVASAYELEDTTYREIHNAEADAVRWDFHRLLQKWDVELYRYDRRLTYDIVVPEPGSFLLRRYIELENVERALAEPFNLPVSPSALNDDTWTWYRDTYRAPIEPPPAREVPCQGHEQVTYGGQQVNGVGYVELSLSDGYQFDPSRFVVAEGEAWKDRRPDRGGGTRVGVIDAMKADNVSRLHASRGGSRYSWRFSFWWFDGPQNGQMMDIGVVGVGRRSARLLEAWQTSSFERLLEAAKSAHEDRQHTLERERDRLRRELDGRDVLDLRRIEREELMKAVLRWMLGPEFDFFPETVSTPLDGGPGGEGALYDERGRVRLEVYETTMRHGALIRFLHDAIEWESVNFVLYPYFWSDHRRWDLKQRLMNADALHWSFLKSGAARVVLTIRPGFEPAWLNLVEAGVGNGVPADHPYVTIATEMARRANQAGHREGGSARPPGESRIDFWTEYTPTGALHVKRAPSSP